MKKLVAGVVAVAFISGCTTDPFTGEQRISNTAGGATIGALTGAGLGLLAGAMTGETR